MSDNWLPAHDSQRNSRWKDYPNIDSPIIALQLNTMETDLDEVDKRVVDIHNNLLPLKADLLDLQKSVGTVAHPNTQHPAQDTVNPVRPIEFDETTGKFLIRLNDGTAYEIDTNLEQIAVNFAYDHQTKKLILYLSGGGTDEIDLSDLIDEYDFTDTSTIHFAVDGTTGSVTASVINGSITEEKLQPNFLADCRTQVSTAQGHAQTSEAWAKGTKNGTPVASTDEQYNNHSKYFSEVSKTNSEDSEAWAVGQRGGTNVPSTATQYHNNAKYYAEQMGILLDSLEFMSVNIATTDWVTNYDPNKSSTYPFVCRKILSDIVPENPWWRMTAPNGKIPTGTQVKSVSFVLEAWFGTGEDYYTDSTNSVATTDKTILLYANAQPTDNLALQFKGV